MSAFVIVAEEDFGRRIGRRRGVRAGGGFWEEDWGLGAEVAGVDVIVVRRPGRTVSVDDTESLMMCVS